jgi:hypothetical protein
LVTERLVHGNRTLNANPELSGLVDQLLQPWLAAVAAAGPSACSSGAAAPAAGPTDAAFTAVSNFVELGVGLIAVAGGLPTSDIAPILSEARVTMPGLHNGTIREVASAFDRPVAVLFGRALEEGRQANERGGPGSTQAALDALHTAPAAIRVRLLVLEASPEQKPHAWNINGYSTGHVPAGERDASTDIAGLLFAAVGALGGKILLVYKMLGDRAKLPLRLRRMHDAATKALPPEDAHAMPFLPPGGPHFSNCWLKPARRGPETLLTYVLELAIAVCAGECGAQAESVADTFEGLAAAASEAAKPPSATAQGLQHAFSRRAAQHVVTELRTDSSLLGDADRLRAVLASAGEIVLTKAFEWSAHFAPDAAAMDLALGVAASRCAAPAPERIPPEEEKLNGVHVARVRVGSWEGGG